MEVGRDNLDPSSSPGAVRAAIEDRGETLEELRTQVALLREQNRRLEHLLRELRRALYGRRSEKLSDDERQLAFEDLEGAVSEAEESPVPSLDSPSRKVAAKLPPPARNLGNLPKSLPRVERVVEPDSTQCPCGCGEMVRIGEERTERLDIVPAKLRVLVTIRPKYACRVCEQGVTQAPAPAHLIEGGLPTEGTIAQVLVSKYADHCPLYRQSQIYARSGVELHRSTLADWVGKASFHRKRCV